MNDESSSEALNLLKAEIDALRATLENLQVRINSTPRPVSTASQTQLVSLKATVSASQNQPGEVILAPTSRRRLLKKLGTSVIVAGGAVAGVSVSHQNAQAKVSDTIPTIGAVILPGKMSAPSGTPPAGRNYGLIATSDSAFNLTTLPANNAGAVIRGGATGLVVSGLAYGVDASSPDGVGVNATTNGLSAAVNATNATGPGIAASGATYGLNATSNNPGSVAVNANSPNGVGIQAAGSLFGLKANSTAGIGLSASGGNTGITADSSTGVGVLGGSNSGIGVVAKSTANSPLKLEPKTSTGAPASGSHTRGELWLDNLGDLYLCKADGTPGGWRKVNDRTTPFDSALTINVRDFGAKGDGITDDTDAIQSALDQFSRNETTLSEARTGSIYFPPGDYIVKKTLRYIGNPGAGLKLYGEAGRARSGSNQGSILVWYGADMAGTMFKFEGANGTTIENLFFYGRNACKRLLWFDAYGYPSGYAFPYTGCSGVVVRECSFSSTTGSGSSLVTLGHEDGTGVQVDTFTFYNCYFSGNDWLNTPDKPNQRTEACFKTLSGGNTKVFNFYSCLFLYTTYGLDCSKDSGPLVVVGGDGGACTDTFFKLGGSYNAIIDGYEVESGSNYTQFCRFLESQPGSGDGTIIVRNCSVTIACKTDDIFIASGSNLILEGNAFTNVRTPTSPPKIFGSTIYSFGNYYANALDHAEFYDGSMNNTLGGPADTYYKSFTGSSSVDPALVRVTSLNDKGGSINTTAIPVRQTASIPVSVVQLQPYGIDYNEINAGFKVLNIGETRYSSQRITIDYNRWSSASTYQSIILFELPPRSRLVDIVVDTTISYQGTSGALELGVGTSDTAPGGQEYILRHDVKGGPVTKGLLEADLGPNLVVANRAQSSYTPSWNSSSYLRVALNSSSGNLNTLTGGSTTFYVTYLRYP